MAKGHILALSHSSLKEVFIFNILVSIIIHILSQVGILVKDEKKTSKDIWRCALICFTISLLSSPLPTFLIGFLIGFIATGLIIFYVWISVAAPMDGFWRVRLAVRESWLPGSTTKVPTTKCSLARVGKEVENENYSSDFVFVDVWNMWPLEFEQYKEEKCNTRKTHTVIVEVNTGTRQLRLFYPVHNLPRYHCQLPEEVEIFSHHHLLDLDECLVSLVNPDPGRSSQLYSKKQPLRVRPKHGNVAFYLFPVVKRNKEFLFKLLKPEEFQEETKVELDRSRELLEQCRLLGHPDDLASRQLINMLATRLGARFLTKQMIFNPIKRIFKKKLVSKMGRLLKNLSLSGFQLGKLPLVTKVLTPSMDERGLWLQLTITAGCGASITMEANSLNLPSVDMVESEVEQESDDSEEVEHGGEEGLPPFMRTLLASFDRELDELAFVLTLEKLELEVMVNIPPPHPSSGPSLWLGLARPPHIELQINARGASQRLTDFLNNLMPMLRSAILTK